MPPRLYLVDQNLTSPQGHYLTYASELASAALNHGIEPFVLGHASSPRIIGTLSLIPLAPDTYWQQVCPPCTMEAHHHHAAAAARLADALVAFQAREGMHEHDVLFFPNANLTVLLAGADFAMRAGGSLPRTVFLFRREWAETARVSALPAVEARALLRHGIGRLTAAPGAARVRLLTDSEELTNEYVEATRTRVQTAPIPVDSRLNLKNSVTEGEITVLYLGDARREKGYHHLPAIVDTVRARIGGHVRFILQSNYNTPGGEPGIAAARDHLWGCGSVQLLEAPVTQDDYVAWLQRASLVLLPYDPLAYSARTSGILAEAICGGVPVLVPAGTWLSTQVQASGAGVCYDEDDSAVIAEAAVRALEDITDLRARARARQSAFRRFHNAERLLAFVCGADVMAVGQTHRASQENVA